MRKTSKIAFTQWIVSFIIFTLLLVLMWPFALIGVGKTIALAIIYILGAIVSFIAVDENDVELPLLFGRENTER